MKIGDCEQIMNIYLAGSFAFEDKEKSSTRKYILSNIATTLRQKGYDVFCPWEHAIHNAWDLPNRDWGMAVYGMDTVAIKNCDVLIMLSYGKAESNNGSAWECGFASGIGKKVIVVSMTKDTESLMIIGGCAAHLSCISDLYNCPVEEIIEKKMRTANNEVS